MVAVARGCVCCLVALSCLTLGTPWTVAHQAPLTMGFPGQEFESGLPFLSLWDLPDPEIEPMADGFFTNSTIWETRGGQSVQFSSVQFSSVAQSCPTLRDPMNCSTPGLPVHHQLLEFTQTHVHRVGDAIQPSHPLSSPSPPARNPSQQQDLFQ